MHSQQNTLTSYFKAVFDLFYTPACVGCSAALLRNEPIICITCQIGLPLNPFFEHQNNEVQQVFAGRLPLVSANALLYFTKNGIAQNMMHALKYQNRQDVGEFLGRRLALELLKTNVKPDVILPVPLHPSKQKARGYNQCHSIARGMQGVYKCAVNYTDVRRTSSNQSQTKLNRVQRWDNVKGIFEVKKEEKLVDKHVMLIDDTLTTGATLESCGQALLGIPGIKLSVATLAYAQ
jgi:ComF family protein